DRVPPGDYLRGTEDAQSVRASGNDVVIERPHRSRELDQDRLVPALDVVRVDVAVVARHVQPKALPVVVLDGIVVTDVELVGAAVLHRRGERLRVVPERVR